MISLVGPKSALLGQKISYQKIGTLSHMPTELLILIWAKKIPLATPKAIDEIAKLGKCL